MVSACRAGSHPALNTTWALDAPRYGTAGAFDKCQAGGAFGVDASASGLDLGRGASWTTNAPPFTAIAGVRLWRFVRASRPVSGGRWYQYRLTTDNDYEVLEGTGLGTSTPLGGNPAVAPFNPPAEYTGLDERRLTMSYWCSWELGTGSTCPKEDYDQLLVFRSELTLRDSEGPTLVRSPTGNLLDATSVNGARSLSVVAADRGGGVRDAELHIDGQPVATANFGCAEPFVDLVPCPTAGDAKLTVDTASLADGPHQVSVVVHDATGTNSVTAGPYVVITDNVAETPIVTPVVAIRTPNATAALNPTLTAAFAKSHGTTIRARLDRPPTVEGQLLDQLGQPIRDALVELSSRERRAGSSFTVQPAIKTDANGRFSVQLAGGPSRDIRVGYRAYLEDAAPVAERLLSLTVPAAVALRTDRRTLRNGQAVRFIGTVKGATGADRTRVDFQALTRNGWQTFKTVPMRNSRFSTRYRFKSTFERTRYAFRAIAHADASLAFARGVSPTVRVVVRP